MYQSFWEALRERCERLTLSDVFPVSPGVPEEYEEWDVMTPWHGLERGDDGFDVVVCVSLLEHLDAPWRALKNLFDQTAEGGHVLVTQDVIAPGVPNILTGATSLWPNEEYKDTAIMYSDWVRE